MCVYMCMYMVNETRQSKATMPEDNFISLETKMSCLRWELKLQRSAY